MVILRNHVRRERHPLLGDETYGRRRAATPPISPALLDGLGGVALHAAGLSFSHPASGAPVSFESPLPPRIARLLDALREGGRH